MAAQFHVKPVIVHWIWSLSLGGDAKNLCALALEQSKWATVVVAVRLEEAGERAADLRQENIEIYTGINDAAKVQELQQKFAGITAVIMHRHGRPDPAESIIVQAFSQSAACFEFNTFGRADETTDRFWTGHLFPSRSCLMQYAKQRRIEPLALPKHCAPGYAVPISPPLTLTERQAARQALGIGADEFVALRIQRPDLRKWDPLPVLAIERLRQQGRPVRLIVQAVPPKRAAWVRQKTGNTALLQAVAADAAALRQSMAASDCFLSYAQIGETFGMAMAEAMCCELPILSNAIPQADNAQIEINRHGKTGLVANSVEALCSALRQLKDQPDYRLKLGQAARQHIIDGFAPELVEARVRRFIRESLPESARLSILALDDDGNSYPFNPAILAELESLNEQKLDSGPADFSARLDALPDALNVQLLRWQDTLDYAAAAGFGAVLKALRARVSRSSLRRN